MADSTAKEAAAPSDARIFETLAEAQAALKTQAYSAGYDLAIKERYPRRNGEEATRITYRCAKGKAPISQASDDTHESKRRKHCSRMTNCPFTINLKLRSGGWQIEQIRCRKGVAVTHNHDLVARPEKFSTYRRQALAEHKEEALDMWRSGMRPRDIRTKLLEKSEVKFSYHDIYNLVAKARLEEGGEKSRGCPAVPLKPSHSVNSLAT